MPRWLCRVFVLIAATGNAGRGNEAANSFLLEDTVLLPLNGEEVDVGPFVTQEASPAHTKTTATLAADEQALTVVFQCADQEVIHRERRRDDPSIWKDDCIEIFLDPAHRHDLEGDWVHVIVSAAGHVFDERGPIKHQGGDAHFDVGDLQVETALTKDGWTARIVLPWASVSIKPEVGRAVGFNLNRAVRPSGELLCLFPTRGAFLAPDTWGHFVLADPDALPETASNAAHHGVRKQHTEIIKHREKVRQTMDSLFWSPVPPVVGLRSGIAMDTHCGHESIGCEANPTGNPIGGGDGYDDIYTTGDFVVTNAAELALALRAARVGQVVFVPDGVDMDLGESPTLEIPAGVTLAGTRGHEGSAGARIFNNRPTFRMFRTAGDDVRITGLRFEGQHGGPERLPYRGAFLDIHHHGVRVDNCEIYNFSGAGAITLLEGASYAYIHHNDLHHIQQGGLGYPISHNGGGPSFIIANTFNAGRHHIAATGRPGEAYEAAWNRILTDATSHHFDMHGGRDRGDGTDIAGDWLHIHHNTFLDAGNTHVGIRGMPSGGADIHNNRFGRERAVSTDGNTQVFDNEYGLDEPRQPMPPVRFETQASLSAPSLTCRFCPCDPEAGTEAGLRAEPVATESVAPPSIGAGDAADAQTGIAIERPDTHTDRWGDPLPEGAVRRLGSRRLMFDAFGDLAYLEDGRALIADGNAIECWNIAAGERMFRDSVTESAIRSLDMRADGNAVLIADHAGDVHEWDPHEKRMLRRIQTGLANLVGARYSPDATRVLAIGSDPPVLKELDLESGDERITIRGQLHAFSWATYDGEGRTAIAGGPAGAGALLVHYDLATGELLKAWHRDFINYNQSPQLSPDGSRLLAGTRHMAVEFELDGYRQLRKFEGHHGWAVPAVAYGPTDDTILTGSRDGSIRLWNRYTGEIIRRWTAHTEHCVRLRLSPDGTRVLSFGGGRVEEIGLSSGVPVFDWQRHDQAVTGIGFMPGGRQGVSASLDTTLRVWDLASGKPAATIEGAVLGVTSLAIHPEGHAFAAGCRDGTIRMFDAAGRRLTATLSGHRGYVRAVAYAPDGCTLVSSADDGLVMAWDAGTGEIIRVMRGHLGGVLTVAFSPDGRRIASGGRDGIVRVWETETGRMTALLDGHGGWVESVVFSPDGQRVYSAGRDGIIRQWHPAESRRVSEMTAGTWIHAVVVTPDGRQVYAAGKDGRIQGWDTGSGKRIAVFDGHVGAITRLAVSPDGRLLVSAGEDSTLLVWDIGTRTPVQ